MSPRDATRTGAPPLRVDPRLARSARRWLVAYPPSWRARHADEVVDLLADLAGPSARRVDARTAYGLVVGGLRTRWRTGPPLAARLAFWAFDTPPAARYGLWLRDTVTARRFRVVRWLRAVAPALLVLALGDMWDDPLSVLVLLAPIVAGGVLLLLLTDGERARRSVMRRFVVSSGSDLDPALRLPVVVGPRQRLAAVPATGALLVLVAVGAVAWSAAGALVGSVVGWEACPLDGPAVVACVESVTVPRASATGWLATLAVSAGVGGVLAVGAWRRLARLVPALSEQPWREVVPLVRTAPAGIVVLAAAVVAAAAWEVTGVAVLSVSAVAAPVCVVLLPPVAVLLHAARRAPADRGLAAVDLWAVALAGRAPHVDDPQPSLA